VYALQRSAAHGLLSYSNVYVKLSIFKVNAFLSGHWSYCKKISNSILSNFV